MTADADATIFTDDSVEPELLDSPTDIGLSLVDEEQEPELIEPTVGRLVRIAHFMGCVDAVDHQQDEVFPRLLAEGMDLAGLIDADVAEVVGVKPDAVRRWSDGNHPREQTRKMVYRFLRQQVGERL